MQYRVIFLPGTGGDGFINLLEQADNITPADGRGKVKDGNGWRKHKMFNGLLKFSGPRWIMGTFTPFRAVKVADYTINPFYIDLVNNNKDTIVGAHYNYWDEISNFKERELVEKNAVLIHLYSLDVEKSTSNANIKNELALNETDFKNWLKGGHRRVHEELLNGKYQIHIDIDRVYKDWDYLNDCLVSIGITLNKKYYDEWLTVITI
jgi:hypothetical protein